MQSHKTYVRLGILATLILLLQGGCATSGPAVQSPIVRLGSMELVDLGLQRQTFRLYFNISNPNPFPLPVRYVQYQVFLESRQFASGESAGRFTVPASGEGAFDISVDLDLMSSAASLVSVLRSGTSRPIPYRVNGSVAVNIPFTPPLPFSRDGTIVLR